MTRALLILALATAVRLAMGAAVPLTPDEAYYWEWSRHLAPSYFDHPPAIAWLVRLGTDLVGDTPLGVRLLPILAGLAGGVAVAALALRLGGARAAVRSAVVLAAMPLSAVGLVLATPDAPLLAGTAIALWAVACALVEDRVPAAPPPGSAPVQATALPADRSIRWWIAAGLALGMAMLSKYTAVLLPAGVALAFASAPALRRHLRRPGPYIACALAAAMFLPVLSWNAQHGWLSFRFQAHHGLHAGAGSAVRNELALAGGQLGLVSPVLCVLIVAAVLGALRRPARPGRYMLAVTAAVMWGFFILTALRRAPEPNWPAVALVPAVAVLAATDLPARWRAWERVGVLVALGMAVGIYVQALYPWLPLQPRRDPIAQAYGWDDLAHAVAGAARSTGSPATRLWLAADRYQDAAELAFHLPDHPTVFSLNLGGRPNQYDLWPTPRDSVRPGDGLLVVLDDVDGTPGPATQLAPHFASAQAGARVEMYRAGQVVGRRRLWHFVDLVVPL